MVVAATVVFVLAGIGSPLLGLSVFADTGSLARYSGYRDVLAGVSRRRSTCATRSTPACPTRSCSARRCARATSPAWNPYALGGETLGQHAERRPRLAAVAAVLGPAGLARARRTSGCWSSSARSAAPTCSCAGCGWARRPRGWAGSRSPAARSWWSGAAGRRPGWPRCIPALFWAVEGLATPGPGAGGRAGRAARRRHAAGRLSHRHRVRAADRRGVPAGPARWPSTAAPGGPSAARLGAASAGLVAGVGLAAWQLRAVGPAHGGRARPRPRPGPGVAHTGRGAAHGDRAVRVRHGEPGPTARLVRRAAPASTRTRTSVRRSLVLVVAAVALARPARALLPRGVWWMFVAASAVWTVAIFFGGPRARRAAAPAVPVLRQLRRPGAQRARASCSRCSPRSASRCCCAGARRRPGPERPRRAYGVAVWLGLAAAALVAYLAGRAVTCGRRHPGARRAGLPGPPAPRTRGRAGPARWSRPRAAAWLWLAPRGRGPGSVRAAGHRRAARRRPGAVVRPHLPSAHRSGALLSDRRRPRPILAAHLGHQRYYGADGAIFGSVDSTARLRGFHGHGFV